ncbi:MAG TPA: hypothetical protein VND91_08900, partial [Candidatus Saccharimonadia bacterium]|nr:hypothetical protein [Candidatus Saccharimonadia bacterium]
AIGIDLVIVVLGVVIGIQVSNWNQRRVVDQQAAAFTEHLKADLREEDWAYQLMIVYYREVRAHAELAVGALDGTAPLPDEALLISAYRATQYKQRLRRRSTYDELISTGTIGLIRDRTLRDTAMRLFNSQTIDRIVLEGVESRYREAFRMALPNAVQRALGEHCGDRIIKPGDYALAGVLDYPCTTGLAGPAIADAASALRSRPDLVPLLRVRIADLDTRLYDMTRSNQDILENLRAIAKEKH